MRRLFDTLARYQSADDATIGRHARARLREAMYEVERNEDLLVRAKRRWIYDQAHKAGVDADDPAERAALGWTWRKTAMAQDIIGDIQLWASRASLYASVLAGVRDDVVVDDVREHYV